MNRDTVPSDDDLHTFGKHRNAKFGDISDSYFQWFVESDIAVHWPGIFEYAVKRLHLASRPTPKRPKQKHGDGKPTWVSPWIVGDRYVESLDTSCPF